MRPGREPRNTISLSLVKLANWSRFNEAGAGAPEHPEQARDGNDPGQASMRPGREPRNIVVVVVHGGIEYCRFNEAGA